MYNENKKLISPEMRDFPQRKWRWKTFMNCWYGFWYTCNEAFEEIEALIRFVEQENINVSMHYHYTIGREPSTYVYGEWTTIDWPHSMNVSERHAFTISTFPLGFTFMLTIHVYPLINKYNGHIASIVICISNTMKILCQCHRYRCWKVIGICWMTHLMRWKQNV